MKSVWVAWLMGGSGSEVAALSRTGAFGEKYASLEEATERRRKAGHRLYPTITCGIRDSLPRWMYGR